MTMPLPDAFERVTLTPGGIGINIVAGGAGSAVLLPHGYPRSVTRLAALDIVPARHEPRTGGIDRGPARWGWHSLVGRHYGDVAASWRECASNVPGHALPSGHFLPEEAPMETASIPMGFLDA